MGYEPYHPWCTKNRHKQLFLPPPSWTGQGEGFELIACFEWGKHGVNDVFTKWVCIVTPYFIFFFYVRTVKAAGLELTVCPMQLNNQDSFDQNKRLLTVRTKIPGNHMSTVFWNLDLIPIQKKEAYHKRTKGNHNTPLSIYVNLCEYWQLRLWQLRLEFKPLNNWKQSTYIDKMIKLVGSHSTGSLTSS